MSSQKYKIKLLDKNCEKKSFSCGISPLDCYLKKQASQHQKRHVTATYVLTEINSIVVCGYYTLSSTSIALNTLPETVIKKLPRYPTLPATLLGRLAVDQQYQGNKLGDLLLVDALKRSLDISNKIGSVAVVVDPKNKSAIKFYQHYGFMLLKNSKNRLFLPTGTIKKVWGDKQ